MTAPLFDHYIAVDWSAASRPVRGKDSIWIGVVDRGAGERGEARVALSVLENPPTRAAATRRLIALAGERLARGGRTLIGFDFPFGYPAGTAAALGLAGGLEWRKLWARIDALLSDGEDNANNRFDVGSTLNAAMTGEAFPFWGCPAGREGPTLVARGRRAPRPGEPAERRAAERRVPRTQPVWKLAYAGSAGGQALTGIPRVWQIRTDPTLAFATQIWPFETGLTDAPAGAIILAELYPSLVEPEAIPGEPKDAGQVAAIAKALATRDGEGALAPLLLGDPGLDATARADVEREEAWILGVTDRPALTPGTPDSARGNHAA